MEKKNIGIPQLKHYRRKDHCKAGCIEAIKFTKKNIKKELCALQKRDGWRDSTCLFKKQCLQEVMLYFVEHAKDYI